MSTDTTASGERTTCEECGLPYYAAADACPYCESASGFESESESESEAVSTGGNEPSASRSRETCAECGLPYYADANDDCPYCDGAADADRSDSAEPASDAEPDAALEAEVESTTGTEPEPEPDTEARSREKPSASSDAREAGDAESSLLDRISKTVRAVLTGR